MKEREDEHWDWYVYRSAERDEDDPLLIAGPIPSRKGAKGLAWRETVQTGVVHYISLSSGRRTRQRRAAMLERAAALERAKTIK